MRPMHHATSVVPFVFASEIDGVADGQILNSRGQVDVVGEEQRLTGRKLHDESLVTATLIVVRENPRDHSASFDDKISASFRER